MRIAIGSTNPVKIQAVQACVSRRPCLTDWTLHSFSVQSDVPEQPNTLVHILNGARNRARKALQSLAPVGDDIGIGLESGIFYVSPEYGSLDTRRGMTFDVCVCAIVRYDAAGNHYDFLYNFGISSGFEVPSGIVSLIHRDDIDMDTAFLRAGLTKSPRLGQREGAIGLLSNGRITRQICTEQAIEMAFLEIDRDHHFGQNQ